MPRKPLSWVNSKTIGQVSEVAVLAPIKLGRVPGERQTYEEKLRFAIGNIAGRVERGIPTPLDKIRTIHFGRMIILRPEQYLLYSDIKQGVDYEEVPGKPEATPLPSRKIPKQIDEYRLIEPEAGKASEPAKVRSWLLTLVEFDGDLRVYFRDIAQFLEADFDSIFRNCEDFPGVRNFEAFWIWIRRYQIETNLFYPRYPDLSVARIKELQDFKRRFDAFVAKVRSPSGPRVTSMDELFDEFLRKSQQYASDFPTPGGTYRPGED